MCFYKDEIIVMKTDKSGRFVVTNIDEYLAMGEAHVRKDKEISREELQEIQKEINTLMYTCKARWKDIIS